MSMSKCGASSIPHGDKHKNGIKSILGNDLRKKIQNGVRTTTQELSRTSRTIVVTVQHSTTLGQSSPCRVVKILRRQRHLETKALRSR